MQYTAHYGLKKPLDTETAEIQDIRDNMDLIDATLFAMLTKAVKGAAGGVAELGSDGKVPPAQLPAMNFDPAGSANTVQTNLNSHTGNKGNPHNVTAGQVGAYTKEEDVSATVKALYGLAASTTPSDALAAIKTLLDGKAKFASGSYVGTGGYGQSSPTTLFFPFKPKVLFIFVSESNTIHNLGDQGTLWMAVSYDEVKRVYDLIGAGNTRMYIRYPESVYFKEVLDTKFSFYSTNAGYYQLNSTSDNYNWVIFG